MNSPLTQFYVGITGSLLFFPLQAFFFFFFTLPYLLLSDASKHGAERRRSRCSLPIGQEGNCLPFSFPTDGLAFSTLKLFTYFYVGSFV